MLDLNLGPWLIISVAVTLGVLGLRSWAPKAAARRLEERGSIIGPALKPTFEQEALQRSGADLQRVANRKLHDDMLEEAMVLKVRARSGTLDERRVTIDRAISKIADALTARPDTYEGTKLYAEAHLDRALMAEGEAAIPDLEQAAQLFAKASSFRLGVIENYLGRGWCYLVMSRVDPPWAGAYAPKAVAAFSAGFARSPQNLWNLRGWGIAIDQYARSSSPDEDRLAQMKAAYTAALQQHRSGARELFEWFDQVQRAAEPVWIPVPPIG